MDTDEFKEYRQKLEGIKDDFLTLQEQKLIGSLPRDEKYFREPYKPRIIADGETDIKKVDAIRQEIKWIYTSLRIFYPSAAQIKDRLKTEPKGMYVFVTLEKLDKGGNTTRDPQLLLKNNEPLKNSDDYKIKGEKGKEAYFRF